MLRKMSSAGLLRGQGGGGRSLVRRDCSVFVNEAAGEEESRSVVLEKAARDGAWGWKAKVVATSPTKAKAPMSRYLLQEGMLAWRDGRHMHVGTFLVRRVIVQASLKRHLSLLSLSSQVSATATKVC